MKKIQTKKTEQKAPMSKSTKFTLYALAGVALLLVIILILVESTAGSIVVRNKSDIKVEYVKAYFVDMEGPFTDTKEFENLGQGDKAELKLDKIDMSYKEANLEVVFKLEGYEEMLVDAGYFNDIFKGKITIDFSNADNDKILLKVKAFSGFLPSPQIDCDEEHIVNLEEGYVEE